MNIWQKLLSEMQPAPDTATFRSLTSLAKCDGRVYVGEDLYADAIREALAAGYSEDSPLVQALQE